MNNRSAEYWIETLGLEKHPEGGYFREVYRSVDRVSCNGRERSACTSIYFLLPFGEVSVFHRISFDELWHFYDGSPLTVHSIFPSGEAEHFVLGRNADLGQALQEWVPADCWFGATVEGDYSLVGCTVAPGFEFRDFSIAKRATLLQQYPQHESLITKLTH